MRPTKVVVVCLAGLLLGASLSARADNTSCTGAIYLEPSGSRLEATTSGLGTNENRWFRFVAKANRSYAVRAENLTPIDVQSGVILFAPNPDCPPTSNIAATFNSQTEPVSLQFATGGGDSFSMKIASNSTVFFHVEVGLAVATKFRVRVVETTLFSPRWSTFGGFYTSWGIQNATNASCSVTLKVVNTAGTTVANPTFAVAAGQIVFRDTRATDLNVAANQAGQVILTHDCPPGGIQADAFMVNETSTPVAVIPVKFEPRTPPQ